MNHHPSPARQGERASFSINEFCARNGISRATFYNLKRAGIAPRVMVVLGRQLVSAQAEADWQRDREAAADNASVAA